MNGKTVFGSSGENASVCPGPIDVGSGRITNLLIALRSNEGRVGQVIDAFPFVQPGPFCVVGRRDLANGTIQLCHVWFEFGKIADGIAPAQISLSVVVDEYRGVYVVPGFSVVG